jgi:hypothetical protein
MIEKGVDLTSIQRMMEDRYQIHTDIYENHNTFLDEKYYELRYQCRSFTIFISIRWSISNQPTQFISVEKLDMKTLERKDSQWLYTMQDVMDELDKYLTPVRSQMSLF